MAVKNRKVEYSKRCIRDALLAIMETKDSSEISVKELCAQANVNRSTFYAHYRNTAEVLEEIEEWFFEETNQDSFMNADYTRLSNYICDMLTFMEQNRKIFLTLCKNSPTFVNRMIAGTFSIIQRWLSQEDREPVERMVAVLTEIGKKLL